MINKLDKKNIADIYGLTPMQEGMLFHYLMGQQKDHYFEQLSLGCWGEIDMGIFTAAWQAVVDTNEALRSVFRWEEMDKPIRIILKKHVVHTRFYQWRESSGQNKELWLAEIKKGDRQEKFDLLEVPFRVTLCKLDANQQEMIISNHHILWDGWSCGIILKEFFSHYNALLAGKAPVLPVKTKFKAFDQWLQNMDTGNHERYWTDYFADVDAVVEFSAKHAVAGHKKEGGVGQLEKRVDGCFKEQLERFVKKHKITMAALFYTAWGILLQRYNNSDDVVFGITVSGRSARIKGIEEMVGLFINTLPMRVKTFESQEIARLLRDVNTDLQQREAHEYTSLAEIKRSRGLDVQEDLFDTLVVVDNYPLDIPALQQNAALAIRGYAMHESTHYDLTLVISLFDDIEVMFTYNDVLFERSTMEQLANHFNLILRHIIDHADEKIAGVNLLSADEKQRILIEINGTEKAYPRHETIHHLFEQQVRRTPDHIAAVSTEPETQSLTYCHLNERANVVARLLRQQGVGADIMVGILSEHSLEMLIGVLGILKSGAGYLPLNPDYPAERIQFMISDCRCSLLLTYGQHREIAGVTTINLNDLTKTTGDFPISDLKNTPVTGPEHLAYIMYTSGSTGLPKGVAVTHRNVVRLVVNSNFVTFAATDRFLQTGVLEFDASTFEIWGALLNGLALYAMTRQGILSPQKLKETIIQHHISIMWMTAPLFNQMWDADMDIFGGLRYLLVGGDVLSPRRILQLRRYFTRLSPINCYGPTENTTFSTTFLVDRENTGSIPIGKPIANSYAVIMDRYQQILPPGLPGELWVGGDGVARGYLNQVELTAEKFVFPPQLRGRFYRTGDLARWREDGNIEFLGRLDHQVKIRGFRIELEGIEKQLRLHPEVKETLVLVRGTGKDNETEEGNEDKYLCCYWVPRAAGTALEQEQDNGDDDDGAVMLRQYLSQRLPDYQIPSYFVRLHRFPLTANGKIDRKALPEPTLPAGDSFTAPRNGVEQELVHIWMDILGLREPTRLGIDDNFFRVGGHSLKATRLTSRIHKTFNTRLALEAIFTAPTIREMARLILKQGQKETDTYHSLPAVEEREYYPLSSAQKRLYILYRMDALNIGTSYNIPLVMQWLGELNREKLEKVFGQLITRHESFRTSFEMVADVPVQRVQPQVSFAVQYHEMISAGESTDDLIRSFVRPFDLSQAPLLRVGLIRQDKGKYILITDMHHIIADGVSAAILVREFMALYQGEKLPHLSVRYRDYALWQQGDQWRNAVQKQAEYWQQTFATGVQALNLPTDYARPPEQRFNGDTFSFQLDQRESDVLRDIALHRGITHFMLFLALYNILLAKLGGQENGPQDIVVGTGIEGRDVEDLGAIVGMFVNTLALRNSPAPDKSFEDFLKEVAQHTTNAFENREYLFEDVLEGLSLQRDTGRNPLFDVSLQLDNLDIPKLVIPQMTISPLPFAEKIAKFDLTLWVKEADGCFLFSFEYSTALFASSTIACFARYFKEIILAVVEAAEKDTNLGARLVKLQQPSISRRQEMIAALNRSFTKEIAQFQQENPQPVFQPFLDSALKKYKTNTAVEYGETLMTYEQLDSRTDLLAARLLRMGITTGTFVGVMMADRLLCIQAVIAILKAGGGFVPLDPTLPMARLNTLMNITALEYVLIDTTTAIPDRPITFLPIQPLLANEKFISHPVAVVYHPEDTIYIYFTSGSTGTPKGIVGKNSSLLHFIRWEIGTFLITQGTRSSQFVIPGFDAFLRDIFVPLCAGGTLCIPPNQDIMMEAGTLRRWVEESRVQVVHCVPGLFRLLGVQGLKDGDFLNLNYIIMAGERLNPSDLAPWCQCFGQRIRIVNLYGLSESTMAKTWHVVQSADLNRERIPVGKGIRGAQVLVVDEGMNLCDQLVTGQILLRTPFGSHGYLDDPEFTSHVAVANTLPGSLGNQDILWKTGDLGRWMLDGNLELLNRRDRQVKIRGIRVELGEIETILMKHPCISEAAAIKRTLGEDKELLCVYFTRKQAVAESKDTWDEILKNHMAAYLPQYMVPAQLVGLEKMPRKPNGKIDYQGLPHPQEPATENLSDNPADEVEIRLRQLWLDVLKIERIGLETGFFESGGNSLHLMSLILKIHQEFATRLSLGDIFSNMTIKKQAALIKGRTAELLEVHIENSESAPEQEYYPLSAAQQRLFVLDQMEPGHTGYNMPFAFELEGELEREKLETVFSQLIHRHESLRTSFHLLDHQPLQKVHEHVSFHVEQIETLGVSECIRAFVRPFELSQAPLFRVGIQESAPHHPILIVDMHHIISDGLSLGVLVQELMALYIGKPLPPLHYHYRDYVLWQGREMARGVLEKQGSYWLERFKDGPPLLELPLDYPRPVLLDFSGQTYTFLVDTTHTAALNTFALHQDVTPYMVLIAAFVIFLSRLSGGQEDIVCGTPVAGRKHAPVQSIIGMFVNTLAPRFSPGPDKTVSAFLKEVKQEILHSFENQDYPFENLVEQIGIRRDAARNPLFDVMFLLDNMAIPELAIPGLKLKPLVIERGTSKFDLTLAAHQRSDLLEMTFEYRDHLFKKDTIVRFSRYWLRVLTEMMATPLGTLASIEIISQPEKQVLLEEFNRTATDYPAHKTIRQLLEEQVVRTPDRTALVGSSLQGVAELPDKKGTGGKIGQEIVLSYDLLNKRANALAHLLRQRGVGADTVVALATGRCIEMMVGLWAILKADGAYLPIDPLYPLDRIRYLLHDSGTPLLLTEEPLSRSLATDFTGDIILLEEKGHDRGDAYNLEANAGPENLIYVIYTSGSTGNPKGVMVKNEGFVNLLQWYVRHFEFNDRDRMLLMASTSFDLAQKNLFAPLLLGGLLVLPKPGLFDYADLSRLIARHGVTQINCAPSVFYPLLEWNMDHHFVSLHSLRYVFLGGEPIKIKKLLPWVSTPTFTCRIVNTYGPTECTDIATSYIIPRQRLLGQTTGIIPIGKPIYNVRVFILDKHDFLLPVGIAGEIHITGSGVAHGYLDQPLLTHNKFTPLPPALLWGEAARETPDTPSRISRINRIYKTGDLGRWLPDGNIEFLGRFDYQVKVRGFRIEPGEIESVLLAYPSITAAVVIARPVSNGDNVLCAYIVGDVGEAGMNRKSISTRLREHVGKILPDYMVPSFFTRLAKIPLTPNGKVDREALPMPEVVTISSAYCPPRDDVERRLADIWAQLLDIPLAKIGIDVDFFALGGHSLTATILIGKINRTFNSAISWPALFNTPTIRGLAGQIRFNVKDNSVANIEAAEQREYYPLAPAQNRLYIMQHMDRESVVYNIPVLLELVGQLDREKLEALFRSLLHRHETLRTSFFISGDTPVQRVHSQVEFAIEAPVTRLSDTPLTATEISQLIRTFVRPFYLDHAPLLRVSLEELEGDRHLLMIDWHHIITDGLSLEIMVREFMALYNDVSLPPLVLQYKDYVLWQQALVQSEIWHQQKSYWLHLFAGEIPQLNLPVDEIRLPVLEFAGHTIFFTIAAPETTALKEWATQHGATLYMVLLLLYYILLAKISGQDEIVVGTVTAGRRHVDLTPMIGMFVNTLALKNTVPAEKTLSQFLSQIKTTTLEAFENQDYPLEELVEQVHAGKKRDSSRNPLFDVMFVWQNFGLNNQTITQLDIPGLNLKPWAEPESAIAKLDMSWIAEAEGDSLSFSINYRTRLFKAETITRFVAYFKQILAALLAEPDRNIESIEIISPQEKHTLLTEFNNTAMDYPRHKTLHQLFQEQAERTPDHIAVVGKTTFLTYRELQQQAFFLAHRLKAHGVQPGSLVAVTADRSVEVIIGIMGILMAGAAYLPIDPTYPPSRIHYLLADSNVRLLLTAPGTGIADKVGSQIGGKIDVQPIRSTLTATSCVCQFPPANLAYVIYTSGTTGNPKGVLMTHASVVSLATALKKNIYDRYSDFGPLKLAMVAPVVFDASLLHIFGGLLWGHALYLVPEETRADGALLLDYYLLQHIDIADGTPAHLAILLESAQQETTPLPPLKHVYLGGDSLTWAAVKRFQERFAGRIPAITNMYGPTECGVNTTSYSVDSNNTPSPAQEYVPIGVPWPNQRVYIVDKNRLLLPMGIAGALCVGGVGLALGYLNNPELTAEKFVFIFNERCYHTGDRARWLADGNIQFLGRIDQQVKIRGFRIEPGEIESRLNHHEQIQEAIVIARTSMMGEAYLCAYVVPAPSVSEHEKLSLIPQWRDYLSQQLPDYMVPQYFVILASIPVTPNGKINRAALPEPRFLTTDKTYIPPSDDIEATLVVLWQEVLHGEEAGGNPIGMDDDFFQLGGNSLNATILIAKIHREFDVRLRLTDFFTAPSVRGIAQFIKKAAKEKYVVIEAAKEKEYYPLSSAQEQLYVLQQMKQASIHYNMPSAHRLTGNLDLPKLEAAFAALIRRHESLRTSFQTIGGKPFQKIYENVNFTVQYHTLDSASVLHAETQRATRQFIQPFDLTHAPLLRVELLRLAEHVHLMLVDMHHIITDGSSIGILVREFVALYAGEILPELRIHYKDYAEWQKKRMGTPELQQQEHYWLSQLQGELPNLSLPHDFQRPDFPDYEGGAYTFELDPEQTTALKQIATTYQTTLYGVLLTVFNVLLNALSGQEDIIIGAPVANRRHSDLEPMIGMFVNTLVLRNYPTREKTFAAFLHEVGQRTLRGHENQEYPFDELVEKRLGKTARQSSRNPIFDVLFLLQNMDIQQLTLAGLQLAEYDIEFNVSPFDLVLLGSESKGKLVLKYLFHTALFLPATIKRFADYFIQIVNTIVSNPQIQLKDMTIAHNLIEPEAASLDVSDGDFGF